MFVLCALGLGGGRRSIDMELLSVIGRSHYRDHFSIRGFAAHRTIEENDPSPQSTSPQPSASDVINGPDP
jgi:hypothetical protein